MGSAPAEPLPEEEVLPPVRAACMGGRGAGGVPVPAPDAKGTSIPWIAGGGIRSNAVEVRDACVGGFPL